MKRLLLIGAGIIGVSLLAIAITYAAINVSSEAEDGSRTTNAALVADASASGGSAVEFTTGAVGDACPYRFPTPSCVGVPAGWNAHLATIDGNGQPVVGSAVPCLN